MDPLETLHIENAPQPNASIIWLHGLGADGYDFAPVAQELNLPIPVRFIFPHAPRRPVTLNNGHVMPAWYDIAHPDLASHQDGAGIRASTAEIEALIAAELAKGLTPSRILLAGFSQGGVIALYTGLRQNAALGGILALSTYLPLPDMLAAEATEASRQTPVYLAHGTYDDIIPYSAGMATADWLRRAGYRVDWHHYPMAHSVCAQEIQDIRAFILRVLDNTAK